VRDLVSRRGICVLMDFPLLLQTAASRCGGERSTLPDPRFCRLWVLSPLLFLDLRKFACPFCQCS
jgi:hypothetical protein